MEGNILFVSPAGAPGGDVAAALADTGATVYRADGYAEALRHTGVCRPAAVVVLARDEDAVDLCRRLRAASDVVIVAACDNGGAGHLIVSCLQAGADTAIIAPLRRIELVARLRTLVRRRAAGEAAPEPDPVRCGDVVVDPGSNLATHRGRPLRLTPTEFRLLLALARRDGRPVPPSQLMREVWPAFDGPTSERLRLYVHCLKKKLAAGRTATIRNERGAGYRLSQERS